MGIIEEIRIQKIAFGYAKKTIFALAMKKTPKKGAIVFIFITLLIDITGWGIIIPVVPKLIKELIHGDISEAAKYGGWLGFAYAFVQFVFSPIIGNLSDKYGRRPIILISLFISETGLSVSFMISVFISSTAPRILRTPCPKSRAMEGSLSGPNKTMITNAITNNSPILSSIARNYKRFMCF